jgi:hypothetical protein
MATIPSDDTAGPPATVSGKRYLDYNAARGHKSSSNNSIPPPSPTEGLLRKQIRILAAI